MDIPVPVSRRAALAAGYSDGELRGAGFRRVRSGHYLAAAVADELDVVQRHAVAVLAAVGDISPDAVVSHVSAAVLHGLPVWAVSLSRVHVTRNRQTGGRVGPRLAVRTGHVAPDEQCLVGGVRVTTVARTVVDLARTVPFEAAVAIGDAALHLEKTTEAELTEQLERAVRRQGCPAARRAVAFLDGRPDSVGESRSRVLLRDSGLPPPVLQAKIRRPNGSRVAQVDFLWPDLALVGEFDGKTKYRKELRGDRTPEEVVIAEKCREDNLRALGLHVVRWIWDDLTDPAVWFANLRAASHYPRPPQPAWTFDPAEPSHP